MPSASALRRQIEAALADRMPSALTPMPRVLMPVVSTGISAADELLEGGLPLGMITEAAGPECSGRTSFALSFLSRITQAGKVCAWVDVSDAFHPESAAATGVHLPALLWIRCGVSESRNVPRLSTEHFALPEKYLIPPPILKGLHGGGCGGHPRNEVKGLSDAVAGFLGPSAAEPICASTERKTGVGLQAVNAIPSLLAGPAKKPVISGKPWPRIEQALRVTDLLLQAGGFSAIVLDMGSIAAEFALRVPLATWFRYRAAAERTQASILLLTQQSCAKSSAGLLLRFEPGNTKSEEKTVFTGIEHRVEIARERFRAAPANVVPLRKPPQRVTEAAWRSRTPWAGMR
jgi:recombination protein RecA